MSASITSETRTDGQERQLRKMLEELMGPAVDLALKKVDPYRDGVQRLLEQGDEIGSELNDFVIAQFQARAVPNQYADEEVESNYGYFSGYSKPTAISDQIDILRHYWPNLNPDGALRYYGETYPTLQFPEWVEGPFAIVCPGFFSDKYGEELQEVLKALTTARKGKLQNYLSESQFAPEYLRQSVRTSAKLRLLSEQQSDNDILLLPAQFGIRHRGRSVRRGREVYVASEFGNGSKDIGTMILTNPIRLQHLDDLWIDCGGDEFSPEADGDFGYAPCFYFYDGEVEFGTDWVGNARAYFGTSSASLPQ